MGPGLVPVVLGEIRVGNYVRQGQGLNLELGVDGLTGHRATFVRPEVIAFDKAVEAN